jgi:N-carbamoyl-L-amino-acid hydrolase
MPPAQNLQIDGQRLWDSLMHTAQIGGTPKGGICRLTLTELDRQVRDWFKAQCEALGCTVTVDEVGNMFARRQGKQPGKHPAKQPPLAPIAMGSHLDTQPTGGKFDGVLGVLAALEAMRTLHNAGYETNAPIEIVNWTNEEGSRFAPPMLASGVFAGVFTPAYAYARVDRDGKSFGEELKRIGYKGGEKAGAHKFSAMFELHIEQGPILEDEGRTIGVVQGVQGVRWYEVTITGQEAHTGATPMRLRKNALIGAARMIERIDAIAREHADAVGTVGLIENRPNSRNVVPGEVFFTVDFRHPDDKVLDAMEAKLRAALAETLSALKLTYTEARIWNAPPVKFAPELIECVRIGAQKAGFSSRDMISGAGHDAAYVARVAPTTMIFVPCAGGISHNEAESTSLDECAAGAQVLLNAVLEFDRRLG